MRRQILHTNAQVFFQLSKVEEKTGYLFYCGYTLDGRISGFRFEKKIGHAGFDEALERAVRQTRLPPPPPEQRQRYRDVGLGVRFLM